MAALAPAMAPADAAAALRDAFLPLFCILPRPPSGAEVRFSFLFLPESTMLPPSRDLAGLRPGVEPGTANSVLPSEPSVLPGPWGSNIASPPFMGSVVLAEERTLAGRLELNIKGEGVLETRNFGRFKKGSELSFPGCALFLLFLARFPCSIFSMMAFFSACFAKTVEVHNNNQELK